jgi:hypothetical protein
MVYYREFDLSDPTASGGGGGGSPASRDDTKLLALVKKASDALIGQILDEIAGRETGKTALLRVAARLGDRTTPPAAIDTGRLIEVSGGLLTSAEVANRLAQTRQNVNALVKGRRILGVRFGSQWKFPAVQFQEHEIVPGLAAVLKSMGDIGPWEALLALLSPLDDPSRRPMEMLRRGDRTGALASASRAATRFARPSIKAAGRVSLHPSLDADLEADLTHDREIDGHLSFADAT